MITRNDRIQIWGSQLAANDFPPVCAMTGRPAEAWKRFKFSTPPQWAYALLVLICLGGIGLIVYGVVVTAVSQRASGFLPLTRASRRTVDLVIVVPIGLIAAWAAANACIDTHGGYGFARDYDVERKFRETRLLLVAPISNNLVLAYIGEHVLGMPKSY